MSKGGRTATTWQGGWNSGNTTSIRVPIVLKDDVLDYARTVDAKLINDTTPFQAGDFLRLIDRYIEYKRQNYHPNQNSRELDTTTRAWDELRKLQKLLRESPELLV